MRFTRSTLIATLGSEPQVVTAALDLLLERGEHMTQGVVIHTGGKLLQTPLVVLTDAFQKAPYIGQVALLLQPVLDNSGRLLTAPTRLISYAVRIKQCPEGY